MKMIPVKISEDSWTLDCESTTGHSKLSSHVPQSHWSEHWQRWSPADEENHQSKELMRFDYRELEAATRKYCRVRYFLWKGTYGNLFQASVNLKNLAAPSSVWAKQFTVEQLDPISWRVNKAWRDEVEYVGQHRHPKLLNLIGYACEEPDKALLVYEPFPENALQNFLFEGSYLSWSMRLRIALGVARGLEFLHELDPPLIWRVPTISTANILLDTHFQPKIFNLGFSINCPSGDTKPRITTKDASIYAAPPEYYRTGKLTTSSNVYSFGVFLLQMISGRKPFDERRPKEEQILVDWALPLLSEGKTQNIMDPFFCDVFFMKDGVTRMCRVAEQCLKKKATQRPSMDAVCCQLFYEICCPGQAPHDLWNKPKLIRNDYLDKMFLHLTGRIEDLYDDN